ncbi:MAG: 50S ribosomal protein L19e [Nanoarchaeota archaeon]
MNLRNKKELAARSLGVGKGRIRFIESHLAEINDAITTQDMISLLQKGAIQIKPIKGRLKNVKRTTRRGSGKIKKKIRNTKTVYVRKTRKLRAAIKAMKNNESISGEEYKKLRVHIKASKIKDKSHLHEHIKEMRK